MKKDIVVFRKYRNGDIIALFPFMNEGLNMCNSYMHIGQHGSADYNLVVSGTKPASKEEYADLFEELKQIGYNMEIRERKNA